MKKEKKNKKDKKPKTVLESGGEAGPGVCVNLGYLCAGWIFDRDCGTGMGFHHFLFWAALYFGFSLSVHTTLPLYGQTSRSTQHFTAVDLDLNCCWLVGRVYLDCSMPLWKWTSRLYWEVVHRQNLFNPKCPYRFWTDLTAIYKISFGKSHKCFGNGYLFFFFL